MFTSLAITALLATGAVAIPQTSTLTPVSPASLVQCQPIKLQWSGGKAPYFIALVDGNGGASGATIVDFGEVAGTSETWIVNQAVGTSLTLRVTDSDGNQNFSAQVAVQAGSSTDCLNASSSAAGAATSDAAAAPSADAVAPAASETGAASEAPAASSAAPAAASSGAAAASGASAAASASSGAAKASGASASAGASGSKSAAPSASSSAATSGAGRMVASTGVLAAAIFAAVSFF